MKYYVLYSDPEDYDQGTNHGYETFNSREETLLWINDGRTHFSLNVVEGKQIPLEVVEKVKEWKFK